MFSPFNFNLRILTLTHIILCLPAGLPSASALSSASVSASLFEDAFMLGGGVSSSSSSSLSSARHHHNQLQSSPLYASMSDVVMGIVDTVTLLGHGNKTENTTLTDRPTYLLTNPPMLPHLSAICHCLLSCSLFFSI